MEVTIVKFGRPRKVVEMGEESATVSSVLTAHEIALDGLTVLVNDQRADGNAVVQDGDTITLAPKSSGGRA